MNINAKTFPLLMFVISVVILLIIIMFLPSILIPDLRCGGFEGKVCPQGFKCIKIQRFPDAQGRCILTAPWKILSLIKNQSIFLRTKKFTQLQSIAEKIAYQNPKETKSLYLTKQGLTYFPHEILNIENLKILDLNGNKLTTLPEELIRLRNLEILYLGDNQFTEFPQVITKLARLKSLNLSGNFLTEVPKEVENLQNLEMIRIDNNKLEKIPSGIVNIKKLKEIYLGNNNLKSLPQELDQVNPTIERFFIVKICPNPLNIDQIPKNFLLKTVAYRYFYEIHGNIYEEIAQQGEGITHLARRVINKFLAYAQKYNAMKISTLSSTSLCLEDFLQNKIGTEYLRVGEKRVFSSNLLNDAIFSCRLIEKVCS